ncbi:hypothetical protein CK203_059169 [Vitis vinifera]|uniref:Uncharacterized protein n=1 Tax=Vitis vinifera TaxID=29760 RepID=A0A438GLY1_VITVI|nr:hypothetical protein CK203_059169 [Vitis vinifera]
MDSQIVTIDQFTEAMTSIQEAIASLSRRIDGQQAQQAEVASPHVTVPTPTLEDPHARMDRLEQRLKAVEDSDRAVTWDDFDGLLVANFGSLVQALYDIEEGIARGLWSESSPSDSNGKKPLGGQSREMSVLSVRQRQFSQLGMPLSQALRKLTEAGLLTTLTPRPPPQPVPPQFMMDLHCAYHQGPGHETDRCTALRHAIKDLID